MRKTIEQALPIVAAALGNKLGVEVVVAGQQACTNGQTVVIPNCEDHVDKDVTYGYLAHESAHVRFTDFAVFQELAEQPLIHRIMNVLEDIRIELAIRQIYPGTTGMLHQAIQALKDAGKMNPSDASPGATVYGHTLLRLRSTVLGQRFLADAAVQQENILREKFSAAVVARLNGLLSMVAKAQNTRDCANLAISIGAMLKEEAEKEKQESSESAQADNGEESEQDASQEPEQRNPDQDNQSEDGSNQSGGSDESGDESGAGSDPDSQDGDQDSTGDDGKTGEQGSETSSSSTPDDEPDNADPATDGNKQGTPETGDDGQAGAESSNEDGGDGAGGKVAKAVEEALNAPQDDLPEDLFEEIRQEIMKGAKKANSPDQTMAERYHQSGRNQGFLATVESESVRIAAALHGIVQSERTDRPYNRDRGRKLDSRKLHRLPLGDPRVFVRHTQRTAPNTAIFILLDLSGSMSRTQHIAKQAALALTLSLRPIRGVSTALAVFPGPWDKRGVPTISSVMRFGDDPAQRSDALATLMADGDTPLNEALHFAASRLVSQLERRKTVMVITDGEPNNADDVKKTIGRMLASGMEVYGIGIGTMAVTDLFPQHVVINGIADLKTAMFTMAQRILIGKAA